MAEQISPLIIFSVVFLGITIVILGALAQVFNANVQAQENPEANLDVLGGITYRMWFANTLGTQIGVNVSGQVTEWPDWESKGLNHEGPFEGPLNSRTHFSFYDRKSDDTVDTHHRLDIWVVRNNTGHITGSPDGDAFQRSNYFRDFIFLREYKYSGAWIDNHNTWFGIKSFDDITLGGLIQDTNQTKVSFVGKQNITVFIGPSMSGVGNTTQKMQNNTETIQVGADLFNIEIGGKIGMWSLITDLLTFKMQDVPKPMNYILGIPLWIAISLAFVAIVSRFIPTIPGL